MQPSWYEEPRNRMRERSVGVIVMIAFMGFFAIAGTIFAYYFLPNPDLLLGKGDNDPRNRKLVHVKLEDIELLIPGNLVARVKRRTLGGVSQVILTFMPTPNELSAAERFRGIYQPYIAGRPVRMQAGLERYSFSTSSPYADIEYYIGKIGSSRIHIKCELRASRLGPQLCSHTLDSSPRTILRYRFARSNLADWREIDQTARRLLLQLTHK